MHLESGSRAFLQSVDRSSEESENGNANENVCDPRVGLYELRGRCKGNGMVLRVGWDSVRRVALHS